MVRYVQVLRCTSYHCIDPSFHDVVTTGGGMSNYTYIEKHFDHIFHVFSNIR